jgi:hypothetical protein
MRGGVAGCSARPEGLVRAIHPVKVSGIAI